MEKERNSASTFSPSAVIFTSQLVYRPCRVANPKEENEAFHELAQCLISDPNRFLDRLVEVARRLCQADTVGISMESTDAEGRAVFRWITMAGDLKDWAGGTTPRDFSPCGICVDHNQPTLMRDLARAYPYFNDAPLPFVEALLLPWGVQGGPMGTIWVVSHSDRRSFDLHDVRVMGSLAAFTFGAIYLKQKTEKAEKISAAINVTKAMAHHINNPLQEALLSLFRLKNEGDFSTNGTELLGVLEGEIKRVASASSDALRRSDRAAAQGSRLAG
ncbi:MAG TPA: GAF domain-containing protein [Terriglobales bacterium]|nr:GAF domain-containing protein [Terriglobales bacterium]